ncbi:hypothetical protein M758_10G172700 [Ceratodon purpureus]|nr:hypothetical protein M758_10G172700 [Ceratodon purpureus]
MVDRLHGAEGEQYSHPMVSFFSVAFKFTAIGFYILCSLVIHNFVIQFVITVFLVALDFWTVKNVSGRLLVGLRWWNDINDEGESVWHFESLDQQSLMALSKKDSWLFWWSLYLSPVIWLGLGLIAIIKFNFDYLLVVVVALVLNIANIVGFTRCQKDAKKQIEDFARQTVGARVASSLQSAFSV